MHGVVDNSNYGIRELRMQIEAMTKGWPVDPQAKQLGVARMWEALANSRLSPRDHARAFRALQRTEEHHLRLLQSLAALENQGIGPEEDDLPTSTEIYLEMIESVPDPRLHIADDADTDADTESGDDPESLNGTA